MPGDTDPTEFEEIKDMNLEEFFQREFSGEEESLDPELAKEEAKRLAALEGEINSRLRKFPDTGKIIQNTELSADRKVQRMGSELDFRWSNCPELTGMGSKSIWYSYFENKEQIIDAEEVGVHSPNELRLWLQTDKQTRQQVGELMKSGKHFSLSTDYFFDKDGNFAKVVSVPLEIKEEREGFSPRGGDQKYVKTEMAAGDFELAGRVLTRINEILEEADS
jgi:hypothetical protein